MGGLAAGGAAGGVAEIGAGLILPVDGLVVALPVVRPLASRQVVRENPFALPCVMAEPVARPLASRYWVRAVLPPLAWVCAVPIIRPEAA